MYPVMENTLQDVQLRLRKEFPEVHLEFAPQIFPNHAELWVYVLNLDEYDRVSARCDQLSVEMNLDRTEPEIWLLAKSWTGPWPGGESEQKLRERREKFKREHKLNIGL